MPLFVLKGCVIFLSQEVTFFSFNRLRDFCFGPERLRDFFVPKGCVNFLSQEVA